MIPKRISLKNFLSFGEPAVEFNFGADEPLWILSGPNGIGKSAVFDAITYSLYGRHRDGMKEKADQLIRHGANGFEIEFDFEFNGIDYRIGRTRFRKRSGSSTTQYLLKRVDGEWVHVRGSDPAGSVKADDIDNWVKSTLGLGFDAFTSSVLLQQGKADKLFSSGKEERIAILKGIIGFEQLEALSQRIHNAAADLKKEVKILSDRLAKVEPVTDDELTAAENAVKAAQLACDSARKGHRCAVERNEQSKQWRKLEERLRKLDECLKAAESLRAEGSQIRKDKSRLDELSRVVPVLESLFQCREQIAKLKDRHEIVNKSFESTKLALNINLYLRLLLEVEAVESLELSLLSYPDNLDAQVANAITAQAEAEKVRNDASESRIRAEELLKQARKQQERFSELGATCSLCGQPISASRAKEEKTRIAKEVKKCEGDYKKANTGEENAAESVRIAIVEIHKLQKASTERDRIKGQTDVGRARLSAQGEAISAIDIRNQLAALRNQRAEKEGRPSEQLSAVSDAKHFEAERKALDKALSNSQSELALIQRQLDSAQGREEPLLDQLSAVWQERSKGMNKAEVQHLAAELRALCDSKVAEKCDRLDNDEAQSAGWQSQRATTLDEINAIPEDSRLAEKAAQRHLEDASNTAGDAERTRDELAQTCNLLTNRRNEFAQMTEEQRRVAEQFRLHETLDKLLGESGLQRELVRDAEEQILAFANETLQNLAKEGLSLEEDTAVDSSRAFDLQVRVGGGELTGVAFLSGSQKFRVAVSIALAVGRFAGGRARRLEAVIIDEGFGSLDQDGLRAMAEELKRLQRTNSLKRVILVSHQPEFTRDFSVGYFLAAGENGTIANPFFRK